MPAVSLLDGEVVVVREGRYETLEDEDGTPLDPVAFVEQLLGRYSRAFVADITGIETGEPQLGLVQELSALGEIWIDPGIRSAETAMDVLVAGAHHVVFGTKTLAGVEELAAALRDTESVSLGIDWDGVVVGADEQIKHLSPAALLDIARNLGVGRVLFNDLGRSRERKRLETEIIRSLARGPLELYVAGGVTEEDLPAISSAGAAGALLSLLSIVKEAG
ncbi:MAG: HisA/HisF-related TIM barrel protein [Thermoplasmatota archaeon]